MSGVIHIAAAPIRVGQQLRQRCGWCGATLLDYDLTQLAFPIPTGKTAEQARTDGDGVPAMWAPGALIGIEGPGSWLVDHKDGDRLPADACAQLDHEVTR